MQINDTGKPIMQYDSSSINVEVSAGVNFSIQRSRALQQIIALMQASEMFAKFINSSPQGLSTLLDNIEMRGIDKLKESVDGFLQQQAQQAQQSQQQAMMQNPAVIRAQMEQARIQQDAVQSERKSQIDAANVAVLDKNADTNRMKVLGELGIKSNGIDLEAAKLQAENARTAVDMAIRTADTIHKHNKVIQDIGEQE